MSEPQSGAHAPATAVKHSQGRRSLTGALGFSSPSVVNPDAPAAQHRGRVVTVGIVELVVVNQPAAIASDFDPELVLAAAANEEARAERQTDDPSLTLGLFLPAND